MKIIPPKTITDAMLIACSLAEPDPATSEVAWSATEINVAGDQRYVGAPSNTVTISIATPAVFTLANNGFALETPVVLTTTGALPTGLNASQTYYVRTRLTDNTFTVSDEIGGRAIAASGTQSGTHTITAKVHRIYEAAIGQKAVVTFDNTTDKVAYTAHGFAANTQVVFQNSGGALPAGLSDASVQTYYVINPTANDFQLSLTSGGSAVNFTTNGTGTTTCGLAANYNKPPAINTDDAGASPVVWVDAGPTNRWAAFDESLTTVAQANDHVTWLIKPGRFTAIGVKAANSAALYVDFQISRATVTISVATPGVVTYNAHGFAANTTVLLSLDPTDPTAALPTGLAIETTYYVRNPTANTFELSLTSGGASVATTGAGTGTFTCGQQIYQKSVNLTNGAKVGSWYAYFNTKIVQKDSVAEVDILDAALFDLPAYGEGILTVTLRRTGGTVSLGAFVFGKAFTVGDTLPGPEKSVVDYTAKKTDDFGNVKIYIRPYSDRQTVSARIPKASVDSVDSFLKAYRGRPLYVVVDESGTYSCLQMYGFWADWSIPIAPKDAPLYSNITGRIEGLTAN